MAGTGQLAGGSVGLGPPCACPTPSPGPSWTPGTLHPKGHGPTLVLMLGHRDHVRFPGGLMWCTPPPRPGRLVDVWVSSSCGCLCGWESRETTHCWGPAGSLPSEQSSWVLCRQVGWSQEEPAGSLGPSARLRGELPERLLAVGGVMRGFSACVLRCVRFNYLGS